MTRIAPARVLRCSDKGLGGVDIANGEMVDLLVLRIPQIFDGNVRQRHADVNDRQNGGHIGFYPLLVESRESKVEFQVFSRCGTPK